jgi:serine/threonine-protein kinase
MDELETLAVARVGTAIAGWTVERVLGVGGMASVLLARHADGRVAALKVLHGHLNAYPEVTKRFLREGPLASALATMDPLCDGLARVYETGVAEDGAAYLVMELLDGETVFDRVVRTGVLPRDEALQLAERVLDVLVVAHRHGIIHRDIKPENLHFGADGRVRVLDFGIARVLDPLPDGVGVLPEKTVTKKGVPLGTSHYMAPEQATGLIEHIDGRTDLFGLGATLFWALSGKTIHGDLPATRLLVAAATQRAPSLASVAPDVPDAFRTVVDRALMFLKTHRYPDAQTMRGDIRALRAGEDPPYCLAIAEGRVAPGARPDGPSG